MSSNYKITLPAKALEDADPKAAEILANTKANMGMIPNMYATMANSPAMLETYTHGYSLFRAESGFTSVEQEVVFLAISRENECHYCIAAHSFVADNMSMVPADVTDAIRSDSEIEDEKLAALVDFTRTMFVSRGHPSQEDVDTFLKAGYAESNILDIILALAVKTISNYSNHVFDPTVDDAFAARTWEDRNVA